LFSLTNYNLLEKQFENITWNNEVIHHEVHEERLIIKHTFVQFKQIFVSFVVPISL